jgi:hypothetical protein
VKPQIQPACSARLGFLRVVLAMLSAPSSRSLPIVRSLSDGLD